MQTWDLGGGFTLVEADAEEFALFHAFYREDPWMRDSRKALLEMFCPGTPCRFIELNGRRIGGALAGGGVMGEVFVIPPYGDRGLLLRRLAVHVRKEQGGRIFAHGVTVSEMEDYHRIGFQLTARIAHTLTEEPDYSWQFMRMMVRPVQTMSYSKEDVDIAPPKLKHAAQIVQLLGASYAGGDPLRQSGEDFAQDVAQFFGQGDTICQNASSVAMVDGEILGVCLIARWEGSPLIFDVAVHPKARQGGLARAMIARGIDTLYLNGENQLRLFLECGNPAESLYHSMGFLGGPPTTSMVLE